MDEATASAAMGGALLVSFAFAAAFWIYFAVCFQAIAKRTGTPNGWLAWIPVANVILVLQIAQKPLWWFLLFFIPFVNIVVFVMMYMALAKRLGKPEWVGALVLVPGLNLVLPAYLAYSK